MKIKSYIKELERLAEKYPDAHVVQSDEDGVSFYISGFSPTAGFYEYGTFVCLSDFPCFEDEIKNIKVNAILL